MTHKTLGELILTDFDAARPILEAWARGEPLERYSEHLGWVEPVQQKTITLGIIYRIPPHPHSIDWSGVDKRIVAFETDIDGRCWGLDVSGKIYRADLWISFRPGTMPWQESRIERPKEVK